MTNGQVTRGSGILEHFLSKKRAEKANSLIPKKHRTGRILDVGCGSYPYFLTKTEFKEKYGIDPSLAKVNINGIKLLKSNISQKPIPFKESFFDVTTMLAVFEHIDQAQIQVVLNEVYRTLKKDGVFVITTPSPWSDKLLHQMSKFNLISEEEIHDHKSHHSRRTIINMIKNTGFKNIRSGYFELGFNMWFKAEK